ncbi:hypothetical protein AAC387_Pa10g0403 [Persea americana]
MQLIRQRLRVAQSRQKSYADVRRRDLEFAAGDKVFLKVSPTKGVMRFGNKGKLSPRFVGPFEILERIGDMAYRLALPPQLVDVHDVFHVSMLRKYEPDPSHVLSFEELTLEKNLTYEEIPMQILDRQEKVLRNKRINLVKVLWRNHSMEEATWESEEDMKQQYPHLFLIRYVLKFGGPNFQRGEGYDVQESEDVQDPRIEGEEEYETVPQYGYDDAILDG